MLGEFHRELRALKMFYILIGTWIVQENAFVETQHLGFEQDS